MRARRSGSIRTIYPAIKIVVILCAIYLAARFLGYL